MKKPKEKIIWALQYVKSNLSHIKELAEEYELSSADPWILSEKEADELIDTIQKLRNIEGKK